jgi:hypothetical protein
MVADTTLKLQCRGHLQWHDIQTKFHKNLPIGLKVYGGGETETDRMVILSA